MALYRSKGIVLRSIRYGEADRILDIYTQEAGLVSCIAKGIRRTRSRFGARLEPFSCVDFMAYHGRTLDTVTQAESLRSFRGVRERLDRLEAAAGMARMLRALSGEAPDRRVFNLLYRALDALEGTEGGFGLVEAAFGLKLAVVSGYAPRLEECVGCGGDLGEATRFAPGAGGFLCRDCSGFPGDPFPVPPGTLGRVRRLAALSLRRVPLEGGPEEPVRRVVRAHVMAHAPGAASLAAPAAGRP
ncbi:DNA repair protein RecO [Rubrobacter xylanophilus DSM 9941]|uniref:DNA repair protein RecO n=1 Tax=Rubrobacter xylanophilus TaxID=49319 RepID=UPI001C640ED5|nr:DNA repair protein RecO [Rubrobacter xylanophilus]QYJ14739.1 DNA repair protein RecO [Rubrobacter xylanophilus DSM 9941]